MLHEMMLTPRPFAMIEAGVKTIELRLNDEKRQAIEVGDWICFYCTEDHSQILQAEVVGLHYFDDFRQLYQQLPLEKCGYRQEELSQAKPEDMELYYSKDRQAKYGVVGIELKLL
ncbi:TPA: ASCH domain-containing protein [Streptococcus equi subsp. zooepidemicus]|uniref:ASCH domain-containing protein n=1 Tax=Streptococcus equi TaxID=1336 RepID=UPI0005BC6058|nr:ASCH domain-containing protein [Streptococcus equi]KIS05024.1 RNA-binding protein [Streptococcus equi subsp. zooepidemicus Sz16]KIS15630.1 RNA-binding protein [Streptococcus equi subsp. zooepidemicus SzAM35]MDI5918781.1 ASCH domain-containing protein [Streptococcus equi subsp. zooepidemicus]MDI5944257.1 ASCH domain-containing protein [Streptococcus equi subsp. zooepidemicus]MDI5956844.1 ASCH domain-containing protein [Streptococcus equi subsp. zooepidemicus]